MSGGSAAESREDAEERGLSLDEVARLAGGRVEGDGTLVIRRLAPLHQAGPDDLALLGDRRYLREVEGTDARAVLVSEELAEAVGALPGRVVVDDPHRAMVPVLERLHPERERPARIHPSAVLERGVRLGEGVDIGPYAVVGEGAELGDRVRIGAHSVVGAGCRIGSDSTLHPHVVLYDGTILGERTVLHSGARLGVDGFGYVFVDGAHRKVPQVGACIVGDDVEIGANTCVDRGSIGRTEVGDGVKIDNLVHLGHNVQVGALTVMAAQGGVSGSTRIGAGVQCGGQVGVGGHLEIGDRSRLGAQAGVMGSVPEGETVSGYPARPHQQSLRASALTLRLPELFRRLRALERAAGGVEAGE